MITTGLYILSVFAINIVILAFLKDSGWAQLGAIATMAAAILIQKFVHKEPLSSLGYRRCAWRQVAIGLLLPIVILSIILGVGLLLGVTQIVIPEDESFAFGTFGISLLLNAVVLSLMEMVAEELLFRGYILNKLRVWLGGGLGLLVSMVVFGLWHLLPSTFLIGLNPLRTPLYLFNMFLLGGLFGLVFMKSNSLIPAAIFHGVWNTLEYWLTGFGDSVRLFNTEMRLMFDPEDGVIGTLFLLFFFAYLFSRSGLLQSLMSRPKPALSV